MNKWNYKFVWMKIRVIYKYKVLCIWICLKSFNEQATTGIDYGAEVDNMQNCVVLSKGTAQVEMFDQKRT